MNRTIRRVTIYVAAMLALMVTACSSSPCGRHADTADPSRGATDNFRDIAGPGDGYAVPGGHRLRRGEVYRSNVLSLSPTERSYLEDRHVTQVFDLRTPAEITARPDVLPAGAVYTQVDILGRVSGPVAALVDGTSLPDSPQVATSMAEDVYRTLASGRDQRHAYGQLLTDVANAEGPVIIHCSAGKDRTGWATALLQSVAGVSREDVFADYLLTNKYSAASIAAAVTKVERAHGQEAAAALRPLLGVQASFLQAAFDEVDRRFGGMDSYLTSGLGLSQATLGALRARLVPQ